MKELYEVYFTVGVFSPTTSRDQIGDVLSIEIQHRRDDLVKEMQADGADPRHYRWTVYEGPLDSFVCKMRMTAERLPDDVINSINEKELEA